MKIKKVKGIDRVDYPVKCPLCGGVTRSLRKPEFKICQNCKAKHKNELSAKDYERKD
jgi:tRNA(Ile2) C34 agmatinyltransferase TiaS